MTQNLEDVITDLTYSIETISNNWDRLRKDIESLLEEVSHHAATGHKELSTQWVMNELRKLK